MAEENRKRTPEEMKELLNRESAPYRFKKGDPETIENARKGGLAKAEKMRNIKNMQETAKAFLKMPLDEGDAIDIDQAGNIKALDGKNITAQEKILLKLMEQAMKGNVKAFIALRDTAGEMPDKNVNLNTSDNTVLNHLLKQLKGEQDGNSK